ncbi:cation:proton antiporter [Candidatus Poribacteria bacterium]|nr:cation:proton antiporter [Candidatus Poribacteria bacterium]
MGVFLGRAGINLLDASTLAQLRPFMSLGLAWVGLLFGIQFQHRQLIRFPPQYTLIAFTQALFTLIVIFIPGYFLLRHFSYLISEGDTIADTMILSAVLILAASASATAPSVLAMVPKEMARRGRKLMRLWQFIAGLDDLPGIIVLGLVFWLPQFHQIRGNVLFISLGGWVISVGLGVLMGLILHTLTVPGLRMDALLLVVIGSVIFSAGIALHLNRSPLFINLVVGVVLANLSPARNRILHVLLNGEKSVYIIFLILVGASWRLGTSWLLVSLFVGVYVALRFFGKVFGSWMAAFVVSPRRENEFKSNIGLGLISQGGMAIVMAINFQQIYPSALTDVVVTVVLLATLFHELISPSLIIRVLRKADAT